MLGGGWLIGQFVNWLLVSVGWGFPLQGVRGYGKGDANFLVIDCLILVYWSIG